MRRLTTADQVHDLCCSVTFGPNLVGLLGTQVKHDVDTLANCDLTCVGWLVRWTFRKPDAHKPGQKFLYEINVFVPVDQSVENAMASILTKFEQFATHEVREGLRFDGRAPFDEHRITKEGVSF